MRALGLAMLVMFPAVAHAEYREWFLGWSADGTFSLIKADSCEMRWMRACAAKGATPTWPKELGKVEDGGCTDSTDNNALEELFRHGDPDALVPIHGDLQEPAGFTVKVTTKTVADGKTHRIDAVITVARGKQTWTDVIGDAPDAKLDEVRWRPDHKAVAVVISEAHHRMCDDDRVDKVTVIDLGAPPAPGGDRKAAQAANVRGMRALGSNDYAGAVTAFRDAIKADGTLLVAHYNLASVSSIAGDLATVKAELGLLDRSTDPAAAPMLAKAAGSDRDFDFASTDPDVRARLKLPAYPDKDIARLAERGGVWSTEADGCDKPAVTLVFSGKKRKLDYPLQFTVHACGGKRETGTAAWTDAPELVIDKVSGLGDRPKLTWTRCPGSTVDGSCFVANERTFHRGVPHAR